MGCETRYRTDNPPGAGVRPEVGVTAGAMGIGEPHEGMVLPLVVVVAGSTPVGPGNSHFLTAVVGWAFVALLASQIQPAVVGPEQPGE
jgi:hypothetical protein